jgi:hypothetical protein
VDRLEDMPDLTIPTSPLLPGSNMGPADLFDYASFLWDDPTSPSLPEFSLGNRNPLGMSNSLDMDSRILASNGFAKGSHLPDSGQLLDHFKQSDAPPILAPIETPSRWGFMRNHLVAMASTSQMVHQAILAFSSLQLQRQTDRLESDFSSYYSQCQEEITKSLVEHNGEVEIVGARVQHVLAALFLLSYIDVSTRSCCAFIY